MLTLQQKLGLATQYLLQQLKLNAPKDTWNLTENGIRMVQIQPNHWQIIIGGESAPYGVYTNERHNIARGVYAGRDNYHWINDTVDSCISYIQSIMGGTVTLDDVANSIKDTNNKIDDLRQLQIAGGNVYETNK